MRVYHSRVALTPPFPDMVWIPGGTFRMGSDKHYPEERPAHRVRIDGFWMDRYPVTNERFSRFVAASSHVTFAELPPAPKDYPNADPALLYPGSLVFVQPAAPVICAHCSATSEANRRSAARFCSWVS